MTDHDEHLSDAAIVSLQAAYSASGRPRSVADLLETLEFPNHSGSVAIEELQAAGLLPPGNLDGLVEPTEAGWDRIEALWPEGQLAHHRPMTLTRVIGSVDEEHNLPVRLAYAVLDIRKVFGWKAPLGREISEQRLVCRAWQLLYPPTGSAEDRLSVRVDEGSSEIPESSSSDDDEALGVQVGPGTWLSVDREGHRREIRQSLEEILFLIAMHAA